MDMRGGPVGRRASGTFSVHREPELLAFLMHAPLEGATYVTDVKLRPAARDIGLIRTPPAMPSGSDSLTFRGRPGVI